MAPCSLPQPAGRPAVAAGSRPSAPKPVALPERAPGQFVFRLEGRVDVPYVIVNSKKLATWTAIAINTLTALMLTGTNATADAAMRFWRAVWKP
jgi:hypothetical protein